MRVAPVPTKFRGITIELETEYEAKVMWHILNKGHSCTLEDYIKEMECVIERSDLETTKTALFTLCNKELKATGVCPLKSKVKKDE